jgi:hypothetical protein
MFILNLRIDFFQKLLSGFIQILVRVNIAVQHRGVRGVEISWVRNVSSGWQDLLHLNRRAPIADVTQRLFRWRTDVDLR